MFSSKVQNQTDKIEVYLEHILLPKLTNEQTLSCEGIISEDKVFKSLKSMKIINHSEMMDFLKNSTNPLGWNSFLASIHRAFLNQKLSILNNRL